MYSSSPGSKSGETFVIVDGHLVTGQNEQSTLTAVQNLILISNARYIHVHVYAYMYMHVYMYMYSMSVQHLYIPYSTIV